MLDQADTALDLLESHLIASAGMSRSSRNGSSGGAMFNCHFVPLRGDGGDHLGLPLVFARDVAPADFTGVMGHDASGRLSVRPGHLMRANGGYLIVDAWRLASVPGAWETVSGALESARVSPHAAPGLVVEAEPVPLAIKLILIADEGSWARLKAIDPGLARFFPARVRFVSDALKSEVDETAFTNLAKSIADAQSLPNLEKSAATALYEDACRRSGSSARVSLDLITLSQCLATAAANAGKASADKVRRADVEDAIRERARSDLK